MTDTVQWNVRDDDGVLIDDLDRLAGALNTDTKGAVALLNSDAAMLAAAPPALQQEVKKFAKPGGGTPPPIASGSFVSWNGGQGKVDLIVTNGKVPGVEGDVEGTAKVPAARVVVYENGKASGKKIGASTHTLKRIPPIMGGKKDGQPQSLVALVAEHEAACDDLGRPGHCHVTGYAAKTAYDRGLRTWPGEAATDLSAEQWALGRVEHFVKVAALDVAPSQAGHDVDLLAPEHPLHKPLAHDTAPAGTEPEEVPEGFVTIDPEAVQAELKALMADDDDEE